MPASSFWSIRTKAFNKVNRITGEAGIRVSRFIDWCRHLYRRFKSREKRFSGMGNLPACFIA